MYGEFFLKNILTNMNYEHDHDHKHELYELKVAVNPRSLTTHRSRDLNVSEKITFTN